MSKESEAVDIMMELFDQVFIHRMHDESIRARQIIQMYVVGEISEAAAMNLLSCDRKDLELMISIHARDNETL